MTKEKKTEREKILYTVEIVLGNILAPQRYANNHKIPISLKSDNYVIGFLYTIAKIVNTSIVGEKKMDSTNDIVIDAISNALETSKCDLINIINIQIKKSEALWNEGVSDAVDASEGVMQGDQEAFQNFKNKLDSRFGHAKNEKIH